MRRSTVPALAITTCLLLSAIAPIGAQTTTAEPTATIDYEGGTLTLEAAPSQQITGETSLPPGTRVTVRVESTSASSPFLQQLEATVTEDGTFTTSGDMSPFPAGASFDAIVVYNGTTIERVPGEIAACSGDCTATATDTDASATAAASDPGFADDVLQVRQGQSVEIPIVVGDREQVTLSVGGQRVDYRLDATVVDGDGDGRVVVAFETARAGREAPTVSTVGPDDRVAIDAETTPPDGLDPAEYGLTLTRSGTDQSTVDTGTLVILNTVESDTAGGSDPNTATPPLDETTPARNQGIDAEGVGALSIGAVLGVVGVGLLLGLLRD
jgi:hypothetical protein